MSHDTSVLLVVAPGLLLALISLPLVLRKVPPNSLYGLRVHATFADREVWYAANAAAGRDLVIVGLGVAALGLWLGTMPTLEPMTRALVGSGALVLGLLVATAIGVARANRLLKEILRRRSG